MTKLKKTEKSSERDGINYITLVKDLKEEVERIDFDREDVNLFESNAKKIFEDVRANSGSLEGKITLHIF